VPRDFLNRILPAMARRCFGTLAVGPKDIAITERCLCRPNTLLGLLLQTLAIFLGKIAGEIFAIGTLMPWAPAERLFHKTLRNALDPRRMLYRGACDGAGNTSGSDDLIDGRLLRTE
jgi:hypothetical protein